MGPGNCLTAPLKLKYYSNLAIGTSLPEPVRPFQYKSSHNRQLHESLRPARVKVLSFKSRHL